VVIGEASLDVVAEALRRAGFEPVAGGTPGRWSVDGPQLGRRHLWMRVPGEDACVVVVVTGVQPDDRGPQSWQAAYGGTGAAAVSGYRVSFHERPFRTRGHAYDDPAASFYSVFVDDVVGTVRDWSEWESLWSVPVVVEPAGRRLARLRRVATGRLASAGIAVDVDVDPLMLALLEPAQVDTVHRLVAELFLPGIRWRFPRDKNGVKLAARAQVLLHEAAPPAHPAGKGIWLVVDGPAPRAEQRLAVRLARAAGRSAPHRWDRVPEYWHTGPRSLDQLWGVQARVNADTIGDVVDALLAGHFLEALRMCEVMTDRGTRRLLTGLPDRFELREWTDKWVANAIDLMVDAAPWLWGSTIAPKQRPQRLASLGGFNPNRRPGLFLEQRGGHALLSFDQSASPLVLPQVCWQRDVDYDLIRLGLLTRDQIPMPPP
jgi:hypothetical protein